MIRERDCFIVITSYSIHYTKLYDSLDGGTTWGAKRWGEQITPNLANEFLVGDWINEGVEAGEMLRPWIIYMGGTAGTITRITSGALRHELRIQKALSQF